jgi:hypothetical protein
MNRYGEQADQVRRLLLSAIESEPRRLSLSVTEVPCEYDGSMTATGCAAVATPTRLLLRVKIFLTIKFNLLFKPHGRVFILNRLRLATGVRFFAGTNVFQTVSRYY